MAAIQNLKILEGINKFVIILLFTSSVAHFVCSRRYLYCHNAITIATGGFRIYDYLVTEWEEEKY